MNGSIAPIEEIQSLCRVLNVHNADETEIAVLGWMFLCITLDS